MSNPFEEYAETKETRSDWRAWKKRESAQERAKRKALKERDLLHTLWKEWHEESLKEFLHGEYEAEAKELHAFLKKLSPNNADELIELVRSGPWIEADEETKYQILRMTDRACIYLREKQGLSPIDDALPHEPDTVFIELRKMLTGD